MEEKFTLLIYKKLKGIISDVEHDELSSWLLADDKNLVYFQALSAIWEMKKVPHSVKQEEWIKLSEKISTPESTVTKVIPIAKRSNSLLKIAAVLVLLIGSLFVFKNVTNSGSSNIEFVNTSNQKKMKALPDGSIVWINKNSEIKYSANFKKNRVVELTGEAFFEVEKLNGQPFIVKTDALKVKVLGTKFNVLSNGLESEVAVKEGKVEVANAKSNNQKVILIKDDKAILDATNGLTKVLASKNELFWHTGNIVFNNTPLSEVVSIIERNFDIKVLISEQISSCKITGEFNNAKAADILEDVKDIFSFQVTTNDQNVWKIDGTPCN